MSLCISPSVSPELMSQVETLRHQVQYTATHPLTLITLAILALITWNRYSQHKHLLQELRCRNLQVIQADDEQQVPLKRTEEGFFSFIDQQVIGPIAHHLQPTPSNLSNESILEVLTEKDLRDSLDQAMRMGGVIQSTSLIGLPKDCIYSRGVGELLYHPSPRIFNLICGFSIDKQECLKLDQSLHLPRKLEELRRILVDDLHQVQSELFRLAQYYGFRIMGAARSHYLSVHPNHRGNTPQAWGLDSLGDEDLSTELILYFRITLDRDLRTLPNQVKELIHSYSLKHIELIKRFIPEVLEGHQILKDQVPEGVDLSLPCSKKESARPSSSQNDSFWG